MKNADMPVWPVTNEHGPLSTKNHNDRMDQFAIDNFGSMIGITKLEEFTKAAMQSLIINAGRNGFDLNEPIHIAKKAKELAEAALNILEIKS